MGDPLQYGTWARPRGPRALRHPTSAHHRSGTTQWVLLNYWAGIARQQRQTGLGAHACGGHRQAYDFVGWQGHLSLRCLGA
jgi:hypothetical protein